MKVFMIGGTGLLGSAAARIFIDRGHSVKSAALPPLPEGAPIPEEMEIVFGNIFQNTDEELRELMSGCDTFVYAAGVDERVEFKAPVYDSYKKFNIDPLHKFLPLCKELGYKRAVILGSYFSYLDKTNPDCHYAERHQYIRSRIDQEKVAESYAEAGKFDVAVLELPYIFGTQPGRKPVWVILIEQLKRMDKLPATLYPRGGTAMLTVRQVGEVIVGAAEKVNGFKAYPIGCYNMKWDEFLKIVYDARGMGKDRKIIGIPQWMMKMGLISAVKDYKKRNVDPGIDPMGLPAIMDYDLFIDSKIAMDELGATPDDIRAAIFDSIKVSSDSCEGKVKLLEMKGE